MPDIVINPSLGKIDFFTVKGEQVTNSMRLGDASTILFTGALSASSISTGGGGAFVTSVQPTTNYLSKFTGNSTIANSLVYDNGTNVGIGTTSPTRKLHVNGDGYFASTLYIADNTALNLGNTSQIYHNSARASTQFTGTSGADTMCIKDSDGNVGIGTTSPTAVLNVKTSTTANREVFMGDSSAVAGVFRARLDDNSLSFISLENRDTNTVTDHGVGIRFNLGTNASSNAINAGGVYLGKEQTWTATASTQDSYLILNTSLDGTASEKVRIKSDGNIGVGTTNPIFKFQVVGSAYVNNGTLYIDSGNSLNWGNSTQSILGTNDVGLSFTAGSATRMFISSSGNIGIGTTTTAARLHVNSTTAGATLLRTDGTSGTLFSVVDDLSDSLMSVNNSAGLPVLEVFADDRIVAGQYGQNDFVVINNKVGIGTTSPASKLEVYSTSWEPAIRLTSTSGSVKTYGLVVNPYWATGSFHIYDYTLDYSRLQISTTGNVGIGVAASNPGAKLDVVGDLRVKSAGAAITLDTSTTSDGRMEYKYNGTRKALIGVDSDNLQIAVDSGNYLQFRTNSSERMRIINDGNVGIGTTSPADKLDVVGRVYAYRYIAVNSNAASPAYATDTNTGMFNAGSNIIGFSISSAEKMRLDVNGNLGIGTSSPAYKLEVSGSSRFTGTITGGNNIELIKADGPYVLVGEGTGVNQYGVMDWDATNNILRLATQPYAFGANGGQINLTTSGNVGIGTTSPVSILDVVGLNGSFPTSSGATQSTGSIVRLRNGNSNLVLDIGGNGGNGNWLQSTNRSDLSANYPLLLNPNGGNVGIGTTSPGARLEISSSTAASLLNVKGAGGNGILFVSGSGKVGIGTTNPSAKLHIGSEVEPNISNQTLFVQGSKTGYAGFAGLPMGSLMVYDDTASTAGSGGAIGFGANTGLSQRTWIAAIESRRDSAVNDGTNYGGSLVFYTRPAQATPEERMRINSSGNVGIGTTSPASKLHISGSGQTIMRLDGSTTTSVSQFQIKAASDAVLIMGMLGGSAASTNFGVTAAGQAYFGTTTLGSPHPTSLVIGNLSNIPIIFSTNNVERMRIDSVGNVGIGTTNPADKLHVIGNIRINGGDILNWSGQAFIQTVGASDMFFRPNSTLQMILTAGGNLGIGNGFTNPLAKLHINSTTSGATLLRTDGTSGTLFSVVDDLSDSLMSVNNSAGLPVLEVFADDRIIGGQYGQNDLVVVNNKVGIGTNNPANKLTVSGSTSIGESYINTTAPSNGLIVQGNVGIGITSFTCKLAILGEVQISSNSAYTTHLNYQDSGINFITMANGGYTDFRGSANNITTMRVKGDGNVGIGTTSPGTLLNVHGINPFVRINNTSTSDQGIKISYNNSDTHGLHLLYNANSALSYIDNTYPTSSGQVYGDIYFRQNVAGTMTTRMTIKADGGGNVGIGTASPVSKLQVQGKGLIVQGITGTPLWSNNSFELRSTGGNGVALEFHREGNTSATIASMAGELSFYTDSGTERMRITSGGNVGIGTTSPAVKLVVNGEASFGDGSKLTLIGLDINSGGVPNFIKIRTKIPFASGAADFTINIKGFRYGSAETTSLMVCWHYYNSTFYSPALTSYGSFAPTVKLSAEDWDSSGTAKVCIVLVSPGYWPKLYVESMYSSNYNDEYADGWDWVDADATGTGNNLATLSYKSNFGNSFVMLSDGNVGIGTTSPGYKLEVSGTGFFSSNLTANGVTIGASDVRSSSNILTLGGTSEIIRITGGNVGIGTNAPVQRLDLSGSLRIRSAGTYSDPTDNAGFLNYDSTGGIFTISARSNGGSTFMAFRTSNSGTAGERMRIINDGNVGIGTTSPIEKLHVLGNIHIQSESDSLGGGGLYLGISNNRNIAIRQTSTNKNFAVDTYNDSESWQNRITILNSGGNVGIGTTSPATKLEVYGVVRVSESSSGGILQLTAGASAIDIASTFYGGSRRPITFTMDGEKMRITATGALLVGNTTAPNPGAATTVSGFAINGSGNDAYITHKIDNGPCAYFRRDGTDGFVLAFYKANSSVGTISITATTTTYNTTSDYRLKENIQPLSSGLVRVNSLKPSVYNWKSDGSNGEGFLAHELAEVVPIAVTGEKDAVNKDGTINPQSVDLSKIVPILVAAIQELSAKVKTLEAKVQILESK